MSLAESVRTLRRVRKALIETLKHLNTYFTYILWPTKTTFQPIMKSLFIGFVLIAGYHWLRVSCGEYKV